MNAAVPLIGFWRTLILLPVAIPQSVSAVVWGVALRPDGLVNAVLVWLGLEPQRFLTSPDQALASIILIVSWIGVGYWMTFILAGPAGHPEVALRGRAGSTALIAGRSSATSPCRSYAGR